jgi:hypothetical protein
LPTFQRKILSHVNKHNNIHCPSDKTNCDDEIFNIHHLPRGDLMPSDASTNLIDHAGYGFTVKKKPSSHIY